MDITIIAVGKLKEGYWRDAFAEFEKRLKPYARLKIVEIAHVPFSGFGDRAKAVKEEGEKILSAINKINDSEIFILTEEGKGYGSQEFAKHLEKISGPVVFIIGGSLGLAEGVKKAGKPFSLSPLTFTHEMARVILTEQLYRAIAIIKNKDYHY